MDLEIVPGLSFVSPVIKRLHRQWMNICKDSEFDVDSRFENKHLYVTRINQVYPFGRSKTPETLTTFTGTTYHLYFKDHHDVLHPVCYERGCYHLKEMFENLFEKQVEILGCQLDGRIQIHQLTDTKSGQVYGSRYIADQIVIDRLDHERIFARSTKFRTDHRSKTFQLQLMDFSEFFRDVEDSDLIWGNLEWGIEYEEKDLQICLIKVRYANYIENS